MNSLDLPPALLRNVSRLGWTEATSIQTACWEPIRAGRDVLGLARTGSGKTAAFLLPLGERLLRSDRRQTTRRERHRSGTRIEEIASARSRDATGPKVLVLCPTRELALQVAQDAMAFLNGTSVAVDCMHGKVALGPQISRLEEGIDLLVATPGRVQELLESGALDLASLHSVVLDEADRMLDMGLGPQVAAILSAAPPDRQTLLFSATMPPALAKLAEGILRNPVHLQIDPTGSVAGHVLQRFYRVENEQKVDTLLALLASEGHALAPAPSPTAAGSAANAQIPAGPDEDRGPRRGVLVFCRTRRRAHWIGAALIRHGIHVGYLHGDRSHAQRVRALEGFRAGRQRVLLATDVAARGLHVESVRTVVQYDLPADPAEYIHRIGRAAHGLEGRGGSGEAIALVSPQEEASLAAIVKMTGAAPELLPLPASVTAQPMKRLSSRIGGRIGGRVGAGANRKAARASAPVARDARAASRDQRRPSKKSRPIGKSQRPGGGVRRPAREE